ncbi:MAG: 50S ribosomal protein L24 [Kiritimatiellae bacterium]|nr:50S ribosomal protein L24 [Kiritimatiellia bacterium]
MSIERIRKNDTVIAVSGADKGKNGKVLQVLPVKERAIIEGLCMRKKTLRKTQDNPQGGIVDKESSIAISNIMLYCPDCKKGVRVKRGKNGTKSIRKCGRCGYSFDS